MDLIGNNGSSPSRQMVTMYSPRSDRNSRSQFATNKVYTSDAITLLSPKSPGQSQSPGVIISRRSNYQSNNMIQKPQFFQKPETENSTKTIKREDDTLNLLANKTSNQQSVFDPLTHKPPQIDKYGYNKETHKGKELLNKHTKNILNENVRIPEGWNLNYFREKSKTLDPSPDSGIPEKYTRTKMIEIRKKEALPDISYDLDGDGLVNGKDYVIARRFDQGLKNYLTDQERQDAIKAIKDGYDKNFVWGVDSSGALRPYRIMQKRGVIVDAEDFTGIGATYPEHPLHNIEPKCRTLTELLNLRRKQETEETRQKKDSNLKKYAHLQNISFKTYYQPEEYVASPKYTAVSQKHEEDRQAARVKGGLLVQNTELNPEKLPDPSIRWLDKPTIYAKSVLNDKRRMDNLIELQKLEKYIGQEKEEIPRPRPSWKDLEKVSMNARIMKENRKQLDIEDMTQKFGNQLLGIHGQELPKFSEKKEEQFYWTFKKSFNPAPKFQSQNLLQQSTKYWAKNDLIKLADTTGEIGPIDTFKSQHIKQSSKGNISGKVHLENHWPLTDRIGDPEFKMKFKPTLSWSMNENQTKCQGFHRNDRTFDKIVVKGKQKDKQDEIREKKMEEVIVKQAPRFLQAELQMQINAEKKMHKS